MLKNVSVKTWEVGQDPTWVLDALSSIEDKGENYQSDVRHGVQQMIQRGVIDSYSIVYRDGEMISGAGTRPHVWADDHGFCYHIAVRGFRIPQEGLNQDYFTLDILVPEQVARGKKLGYEKCIISFNLHNERLKRNLDKYWKYPRESSGPHKVNGIPQWIYIF